MNIENYLEQKIMEFGEVNANRMIYLYNDAPNQRLKKIFSIIHFEINELLKFLNGKLPKNDYGSESEYNGHYNADESRELIKLLIFKYFNGRFFRLNNADIGRLQNLRHFL